MRCSSAILRLRVSFAFFRTNSNLRVFSTFMRCSSAILRSSSLFRTSAISRRRLFTTVSTVLEFGFAVGSVLISNQLKLSIRPFTATKELEFGNLNTVTSSSALEPSSDQTIVELETLSTRILRTHR